MKTIRKERRLSIQTVMSWENGWDDKVRAIALCDSANWFDVAINCMRDGSMGEKDERGVYDRKWWSDEAGIGMDDSDLRPATAEEVALYRDYCPEQFKSRLYFDGDTRIRVIGVVTDRYGTHVVSETLPPPFWKRIRNMFKKNRLPF